jgi:hypothetical protein
MTTWSEHNTPLPCDRCGTNTQSRDAQDKPIHDSCEREALLEEQIGPRPERLALREAATRQPWGVS